MLWNVRNELTSRIFEGRQWQEGFHHSIPSSMPLTTETNDWPFKHPVDEDATKTNRKKIQLEIASLTKTDVFHNFLEKESCLLSQTDSCSALGWRHKSNFADKVDMQIQLSTARELVELLIHSESFLYSQWVPENKNAISDSLSRVSSNLSFLLYLSFLKQTPFGLTKLPMPPEILSWLTCQLLRQPQKEPWLKAPTQSKFALGLTSNPTYCPLEWTQTPTSTTSPMPSESTSLALSPSEKIDFVLNTVITHQIRIC